MTLAAVDSNRPRHSNHNPAVHFAFWIEVNQEKSQCEAHHRCLIQSSLNFPKAVKPWLLTWQYYHDHFSRKGDKKVRNGSPNLFNNLNQKRPIKWRSGWHELTTRQQWECSKPNLTMCRAKGRTLVFSHQTVGVWTEPGTTNECVLLGMKGKPVAFK